MSLSLVPWPAALREHPGPGYRITADTRIEAAPAASGVAGLLAETLRTATGFPLPVVASGGQIRLLLDPSGEPAEAYRLQTGPARAELSAASPHGLFHAVQTLLQLLPPAVFAGMATPGGDWTLPAVTITDRPRFAWRDVMLDVSRHFMPIGFVRRIVDVMAMHKMNRLHWHLTDDQGWRVEIKRRPRLTEVGAWRRRTQLGHKQDRPTRYDDQPHGGFYTQEDIRALVAYAAERHVTVVPEIDMPGHMQAALAAYPELGSGEPAEVLDRWRITERVLHPNHATVAFMQDVLEEVLDLFPGPFVHIGGDECPKTEWRHSPAAQAFMRAEGIADEDGLQSWFIARIARFLQDRGRVVIGWDEILEGGLAEGAVVMCWRGMAGGIAAAKAGHDVIMTPQERVYLDYYQVDDHAGEPLAIRGTTTLRTCRDFEPVPPELTDAEAAHVIGTGAKLWTEYVPTPGHASYMLLPRMCAVAEVAWTPHDACTYADFRRRMTVHAERIAALGLPMGTLGPVMLQEEPA